MVAAAGGRWVVLATSRTSAAKTGARTGLPVSTSRRARPWPAWRGSTGVCTAPGRAASPDKDHGLSDLAADAASSPSAPGAAQMRRR